MSLLSLPSTEGSGGQSSKVAGSVCVSEESLVSRPLRGGTWDRGGVLAAPLLGQSTCSVGGPLGQSQAY